MRQLHRFLPFSIGALLLLSACDKPPNSANAANKLVVTGSSTVAPLLSEIAKRYEANHAGVRIDVQTGGSSRGIADARQGVAQIGMVSRSLKSTENDLQAFMIAKDGIAVILHEQNPVAKLSNQQIVEIYTKQITNWQQLGGRDAPITVVHKAAGRSTLELFVSHFKLKPTAVKPDVIIGDNEQGIKTVAGNPNAIGYVSIGTAEYSVKHQVPVKLIPLDGVAASIANVQNGKFPLARSLNLVTKSAPQGFQKEFIDFARSKEVRDLVQAQYFVPVQP
ncbi:phosphate ABC transporter substrate-binding protein [filamentous cyanobacterium LEGE 11480]|uniref:Phosphate ABC transporter substrate-binding protein n=1 Tax=Romeriopsis navalis LEGE 11480 TaxID=2777977 RepID=A0A928VIV6_9CYAN|nr:phosphate ABC transporter substrate-binding protein [Romeriopsis navalis]MBE9028568.1 phosphate ABC transporter substrate-binding protein [Romeriopsis navalis LEGE 11480]